MCKQVARNVFFLYLGPKQKEIFAFRDRFGIKPLYYCKYESQFIVSSEIKDIIAINKNKSENKSAVIKYLARGFLMIAAKPFTKILHHLNQVSI